MDNLSVSVVLLFLHFSGTFSSGCPWKYTEYSGHCYTFHHVASNFTESRRICQNDGGDLVSVNSPEEDSFLTQKIRGYPGNYWLGMGYEAGKYRWFDGSAVNYTNWGGKNPDCMDRGCGAMYSKVLQLKWEDAGSYYLELFICELVPSTSTPIIDAKTGCLPSYIPYASHCYMLHLTPLNFTESRTTCQNEGSDLVSVNTQAEDNFLTQTLRESDQGNYWIGMEYVAGRYQWFDGSPVTYTNWYSADPSCMDHADCFAMYSYSYHFKWEDAGSKYEEFFICEQDPTPLKPESNFQEAIHLECHHLGWYVTVNLTKLSGRPSDISEIYMNEDTCTGTLQGDLLVFNQTYKECETRAQMYTLLTDMGYINTGILCIFLAVLSQGWGLNCFECSSVESDACGVHLDEEKFPTVQCNNRTDKCAIQVQPAENEWVGILRVCYESGMIGGDFDDSDGCRSWTNQDGYTAFYCFCHTDGCNGESVSRDVLEWSH